MIIAKKAPDRNSILIRITPNGDAILQILEKKTAYATCQDCLLVLMGF